MPKTGSNHKSASCGEALVKYLNATAGLPDVGLRDLYPAFDQGLIGSEQSAKLVILLTRLQDLLATLWTSTDRARIRKCASGCGEWFFARTQKRRHCSPACRQRTYELGMSKEQKERKRARMQRFMPGYYDRNFKANPRAQGD
jgi:hypothetical protein